MDQDQQQEQPHDALDLGPRIFEFILGHIARTGDNPASAKAEALLAELREMKT